MQRKDIASPTIASRGQQFSLFGGPASQSREIVVISDTQDIIQGMESPSSVTPSYPSTPGLSLNLRTQSTDSVLSLPSSPRSENPFRPTFTSRKTSPPGYLTITNTPLSPVTPSSPSFSMPMTPPPSPLKSSSRPSSRESTKSLPVPTHTVTPPNFPRVLHRNSSPTVHTAVWPTTSTFEEAPQFSRHNLGSDVVMPISAKGRQGKLIFSAKPTLVVHRPVIPTSSSSTNLLAPPPFRRHVHSRRRSNSTSAALDQKALADEPAIHSASELTQQSGSIPSSTPHASLVSLRAHTKSVLNKSKRFVHSRAQAISHVDSILGSTALGSSSTSEWKDLNWVLRSVLDVPVIAGTTGILG
ncbi:hypothetical protein F5876DRAFT_63451 [Lentinula aff. lateritia]|uniref:Uncharacterized protein n=1 Tax=Lentinula aff. lateritia TaxID=2804960 RepID=A0ACC1U7Z7_9AGAR|nr:hypothetical protein F5876DRAFT_63451 [Lentinula aff. lateritia]